MGLKDLLTSGGGGGIPALKVESNKPALIRIIDEHSCPEIKSGPKHLWDGPQRRFTHWPPQEMQAEYGNIPVVCIGPKQGCIFHDLGWKGSMSMNVNVVHYIGFNIKEGTYQGREIRIFQGGQQVMDQIINQAVQMGYEAGEVEFVISKTGTKMTDTKWTASMRSPGKARDELMEISIDLSEFPAISEDNPMWAAYQSDEFPQLIDFDKFESNVRKTPAEQQAWYQDYITGKFKTEAKDGAPSTSAPAAPRGATTVKPPTSGDKIGMPGKPGTAATGGNPLAEYAKAKAAYAVACGTAVPWETATKLGDDAEAVDLIIATGVDEASAITQKIVDAANLVKAGEPAKPIVAPPVAAKPAAAKPGGDLVSQAKYQKDLVAFNAAQALTIPWDDSVTLGDADPSDLDLILETGVSEESAITEEHLAAAKLVKAGEPTKPKPVAAKPAAPQKPGAAATPVKPGAPTKPGGVKPPAAAKPVAPKPAAGPTPYETASKVAVPWDESGATLGNDSEAVTLILESDVSADYGITAEVVAAAKLVKAGPTAKRGPGRPPKAAAESAAPSDQPPDDAHAAMLKDVKLAVRSIECLKPLKAQQALMAAENYGGGVSAWGSMDATHAEAMKDLLDGGEEAVAAALSEIGYDS